MTAAVATDGVLHRPIGAVHITQGGAGEVLSTSLAAYLPPNLLFLQVKRYRQAHLTK
jgi:hypothetical protein